MWCTFESIFPIATLVSGVWMRLRGTISLKKHQKQSSCQFGRIPIVEECNPSSIGDQDSLLWCCCIFMNRAPTRHSRRNFCTRQQYWLNKWLWIYERPLILMRWSLIDWVQIDSLQIWYTYPRQDQIFSLDTKLCILVGMSTAACNICISFSINLHALSRHAKYIWHAYNWCNTSMFE